VKHTRRVVAGAIVLVAVPSIAFASIGSDSSSSSRLYVDGASIGGRCSDDHSLAEVGKASTPWCTLAHAAAVAPADAVVLVRRGTYPAVTFDGMRRRSWITFEPNPGEHVTLGDAVKVSESSRIRLRGFTVRAKGGRMSQIMLSDRIELANDDFAGRGIEIRASKHVTIRDSRIHDVVQEPSDGETGYGILANGYWADGEPRNGLDGLRIVGNHILRIPQDGIQVGGEEKNMRDITIARNEIAYVNASRAPDAGNHSDGIQMIGARGLTIDGNSIHDADECILIKDGVSTGVVLKNNVFVGSGPTAGHCVQIYDAPGARIVDNTFWHESKDWPQALIVGSGGMSSPAGTVIRNNIINKFQLDDPSGVTEDYNLVGTGPRRGSHDIHGLPHFAHGWQLAAGSRGIGAGPGHVDIGAKQRPEGSR
jgi:hypothetical protein